MKKEKVRLKKQVKLGLIGILVLMVGIFGLVKFTQYRTSTTYHLKDLGYSEEEIKVIEEKLEKDEVKFILEMEYNQNTVPLIQQKYFLFKNLERYLTYYSEHEDVKIEDIISLVNVNRDNEYYTNIKKTDMGKEDLILVNKYYTLNKNFEPKNIQNINLTYAYSDNSIRDYVYDAFLEMWNDAKEEGYQLIVNSSYRDYEWQESIYNGYKRDHGLEWADNYAARPGQSEHQTGLALDITCYNCDGKGTFELFPTSDEYKWLVKNSYKYGFILRYPEGKENITGYSYESWHYRYVGKDVAKKIYRSGLTFDEYYAYYLEK